MSLALPYDSFDLTILTGKIATSSAEVEIFGEDETLIIDHVSKLKKARLLDARTFEEEKILLKKPKENDMYYEAETMAEFIRNKDSEEVQKRYQELSDLARTVTGLLKDLRDKANIVFTEK